MYGFDFHCRGNGEDGEDACWHHKEATLLRVIMAYYHINRFHSL